MIKAMNSDCDSEAKSEKANEGQYSDDEEEQAHDKNPKVLLSLSATSISKATSKSPRANRSNHQRNH